MAGTARVTAIARMAGAAAGAAAVVLVTGGSSSAGTPTALEAAKTCDGLPATIVGTEKRDVLVGTPGPDVISGLRGDDTIRGKGGDDVICAGDDDDVLYGGRGNDRIFGEGNRVAQDWGDRFFDGPGDDYMHGGDDSSYDYLYYSRARSGISLDRGADIVTGDWSGTDTIERIGAITGSAHDDVMVDDEESNGYFIGAEGDDFIDLRGGSDNGNGGEGNDIVLGGFGTDSVSGGEGDDQLDGGDGYDHGYGGAGTDSCISLEDADDCELGSWVQRGPMTNRADEAAAIRAFLRSGGEPA